VVVIAWHELVGGKLVAARVAGGAVVLGLNFVECREAAGVVARLCGDHVRFQSCVALGASEALLGPSGVVAVGFEVETLFVFGGVAVSAIGVPVHALARPVAPLAGQSILTCIDIEPAVFDDVVCCAEGLEFIAGEVG